MTDLEHILPLWRELEEAGADYVLATVVAVEGSSYRKPGARMLLAQDGRRAGTVSGGCLEAEVARRAWWLTSSGAVVERYSTVADDGDMPYGSGCGGVVFILLERQLTAGPLLAAMEAAFHARAPLAIATIVDGPQICRRELAGLAQNSLDHSRIAAGSSRDVNEALQSLAKSAFERRRSLEQMIHIGESETRAWADFRPARPGLWIFSAGDDARPLVNLARELGWFVAVADGRSHLATRERFPQADEVRALPISALPDAAPAQLPLLPSDAAVVMTHSFEQDSRILSSLLGLDFPLAYLGVLGPQRRTRELLAEAARLLGLAATTNRVDQWLAQMHAPTGLDLGAETPASVALSILAEIHRTLTATSALPLRQVRAFGVAATRG
ncbi:MAG: XdhC family protein [Terracidiphilus sp.]|jgi:xanthine/CO dehydrogenase XdhC/CoxF family maturation factor